MANNKLQRTNPTSSEFLEEFILTIKKRTGLNLVTLDFTDEFKSTLKEMQDMKMPRDFFVAIINVAFRLVGLSESRADIEAFVDTVMKSLCIFWKWFVHKFASSLFRILLKICPNPFMKLIVTVLYFLIDNFAPKLWFEYIEPKLRTYIEFAAEKIRSRDSRALYGKIESPEKNTSQ